MKCTKCGQDKKESEFSWRNKKTGKLHRTCKSCHSAYKREHHIRNREKYSRMAIKRKAEYIERNRRFVANYLKQHPCVDCGEANIIALTFDHVRGKKKYTISNTMSRDAIGLETLKEEVAKCDVRCANCHHIKTAHEQSHWILEHVN